MPPKRYIYRMNLQTLSFWSCIVAAAQGLLSFASPCVLPLLPVYLSYLSGGAETDKKEDATRSRIRLAVNSLFFALGIGATFFVLGLGASSLGKFVFKSHAIFMALGGILIVFFGALQLGFLRASFFQREKRLAFNTSRLKASPVTAFALGFVFSFSWTPCVGPALASILVMAANAQEKSEGMVLIFCYTIGFAIPFILSGIFASSILGFLKPRKNLVKWTSRIGGVILIAAGIFMAASGIIQMHRARQENQEKAASSVQAAQIEETGSQSPDESRFPLPKDFSLLDQNGMQWTLSELKGKVVILNFWATWCPPCRQEMPYFQQVYDDLIDSGNDDVFILGVASPNFYREKDLPDIVKFLRANDYSYPCLMDFDGIVSGDYYVSAYPMTYLINREGKTQNVIIGAITKQRLEKLIKEAL